MKQLKTREFKKKIQTFFVLKRQQIVRMHKTCLTSQFLRLSLARFFREGKHAISRKKIYTVEKHLTHKICQRKGALRGDYIRMLLRQRISLQNEEVCDKGRTFLGEEEAIPISLCFPFL